tara:strand:+ start:134 stop:1207 length:1074 start_codon:yes stop_codon:yes gene_type:complete
MMVNDKKIAMKLIIKKFIQEVLEEEYLKAYSFHKKDYWKRKLNKEFDYELLTGVKKGDIDKAIEIFKKNVDNVNLETSSYCNRKCDYCPVSTYGRNFKSLMNQKLFENIIISLKKINYSRGVCLNLYNEPLADKNFGLYLKFIRKNLPMSVIQTNSNGDYIKKIYDLYKLEECGLNKIKITLHMPKNKKYSQDYLRLSLKKFAKRIGFQLDQKHISRLGFRFKINKLFAIVQCPDWMNEGSYRGGSINISKIYKKRTSPCVRPFREFTIYYNGKVTPCCDIFNSDNYNEHIIESVDMNDLDSIFKIYANNNLSQWRKHTFDWSSKDGPCASCSVFDLSQQNDLKKREKILNNITKNM